MFEVPKNKVKTGVLQSKIIMENQGFYQNVWSVAVKNWDLLKSKKLADYLVALQALFGPVCFKGIKWTK